MKALITICIIFALMLGCIIWNYHYINDVADRLTVMTDALPPAGQEGCYAAASRLDEYWQEQQGRVRLSVSFVELNRVSDAITALKSYAASGSAADLECTRRLLLNAICELRRLESLSLD